ncbi:MAG: hypothetical protein VZQ47_02275 [Treponema sp.]|nr:hypothetical protein [Treponema sp.]
MNDTIFFNIKKAVENKQVKFGEIAISLKFHDGRIAAYTITTTERKNCNVNSRNTKSEEAPK